MTGSNPESPDRFRLLATFIAGRSVAVTEVPAVQLAHTNGCVIFVSAGRSALEQRREILLQSALLGAGSLDRKFAKALRGRRSVARRYLALEGRRVLAGLAGWLPLAATLCPDGEPITATADESLELARSRVKVCDPRSGSASSDPPACSRPLPAPADRIPPASCIWNSILSIYPRRTTRSSSARARSSNS